MLLCWWSRERNFGMVCTERSSLCLMQYLNTDPQGLQPKTFKVNPEAMGFGVTMGRLQNAMDKRILDHTHWRTISRDCEYFWKTSMLCFNNLERSVAWSMVSGTTKKNVLQRKMQPQLRMIDISKHHLDRPFHLGRLQVHERSSTSSPTYFSVAFRFLLCLHTYLYLLWLWVVALRLMSCSHTDMHLLWLWVVILKISWYLCYSGHTLIFHFIMLLFI